MKYSQRDHKKRPRSSTEGNETLSIANLLIPAGLLFGQRSVASSLHCASVLGLVALLDFLALVCA